jgi:hypothetical protein
MEDNLIFWSEVRGEAGGFKKKKDLTLHEMKIKIKCVRDIVV